MRRTLKYMLYLAGMLAMLPLQAKNLVIGVEDIEYYPYFDFKHGNNSFSKTVLDRFAADTGHTITYVALPIKQFSKWLYEKDIDFKFPDNKRWQDASSSDSRATHFSDGVLTMRAGTIVLAENRLKPHAHFKNLGMITGFYPTLWLQEIDQGTIKLLEENNPKILVKQLVNGIIDGIDIDLAVANHYLQVLQIEHPVAYSEILKQQLFTYQLSTVKYPEIIAEFNQWLAQNRAFVQQTKEQFSIPDIHQ